MTYRSVPIGDIITPVSERNTDLRIKTTLGVNLHKRFIPSIANLDTVDLSNYKIVKRGQFGCKLMSVGRDGRLPISLLSEYDEAVISPAYHVFEVDKNVCIPEYLMVLFLKHEFERELWFKGDADVRAGVSWEYFCETKIPLPPIEKQREYVAIYSNLLKLSTNHEKSFADLQLVLDTTADKLMKSGPLRSLGSIVQPLNNRNDKNMFSDNLKGVSRNKVFIETVASTDNLDLSKYKIIQRGEFVYSGMQTGRDKCIRVALNTSVPIIVSPAYTVFKIKETVDLLPEFLMIYFKRAETDRLGWYKSDSSVRANLDWNRFCEFQVPVPPLKVQKSIVAVYHALESRKSLHERLKNTIKDISPVLIKDAKDRCMEVAG